FGGKAEAAGGAFDQVAEGVVLAVAVSVGLPVVGLGYVSVAIVEINLVLGSLSRIRLRCEEPAHASGALERSRKVQPPGVERGNFKWRKLLGGQRVEFRDAVPAVINVQEILL